QYTDRVNLFIGTAGDHGQLYPGAEMPFGLVKLGPDTYPGAVTGSAHAGYDYDDARILGFSHLRFSGVGNVGVGGNILALPTLCNDAFDPEAYNVPFDKASETCTPGYYRATLEAGIDAELTATNHVGLHRYTFPADTTPRVLLDFGRGFTPVRDAHCVARTNQELVGEITSDQMGPYGWYRIFFCIQFDRPFDALQFHPEGRAQAVRASSPDGALVALAQFADDAPIQMKVALSSISTGQARRNLEAEAPNWDFDALRETCRAAWGNVLGRVEVSGDSEFETLFYSHLYRVCLSPFHATTSAGAFMGDDSEVHNADGFTYYNGWSIWDTYRSKFPLLALLEPGRTRDMMQSLTVLLTHRAGQVPEESLADLHGFSSVPNVRLELATTILLDAYAKGISTLDPEATYAVMARAARMGFPPKHAEMGYVPGRPDRTCEFAYDNWATAEMARALGKEEDAEFFSKRGGFFRNVWNPDLRFLRARDEAGNWLNFPDDPTAVIEEHVYEGSMWHWRWSPVHDVAGLIELMGGREAFIKELTYFFENDLHNHGNEPGIHAPWMFAAAGAPWLSQKWVRMVLTEPMTHRYGTHDFLPEPYHGPTFRNTPDGLIPEMDDDDGCMAAWYVFSAMGLFPLCVGRPYYAVGAPLFEDLTLHHEDGNNFRIHAPGWSKDKWYIQSATLNDGSLTRPWISHQEVANGGTLELHLSAEPNPAWGADADLPW
ncbi:MAG: glycoside hydrolase family 92 protein, partial [bacterium]|nr:glycoside hydrolase family 92 protein [bacterium]